MRSGAANSDPDAWISSPPGARDDLGPSEKDPILESGNGPVLRARFGGADPMFNRVLDGPSYEGPGGFIPPVTRFDILVNAAKGEVYFDNYANMTGFQSPCFLDLVPPGGGPANIVYNGFDGRAVDFELVVSDDGFVAERYTIETNTP